MPAFGLFKHCLPIKIVLHNISKDELLQALPFTFKNRPFSLYVNARLGDYLISLIQTVIRRTFVVLILTTFGNYLDLWLIFAVYLTLENN